MYVSDILKRKGTEVVSIHATEPVMSAVEKLTANRIGALVVMDANERVAGILSERDIVRGLSEHGAGMLSRPISDFMSTRLHVCQPSDDLKKIMSHMTDYRIRHLPVVEEEQLCGIISIGDVVKHRMDEVQTETMVLRDIVITSR
jgi:CBS domain-containing protein